MNEQIKTPTQQVVLSTIFNNGKLKIEVEASIISITLSNQKEIKNILLDESISIIGESNEIIKD